MDGHPAQVERQRLVGKPLIVTVPGVKVQLPVTVNPL
jgi:hypothetical protein